MNINEIENILETLESRHPELDEKMLIFLLSAGGWEGKSIREATSIFRAKNIRQGKTFQKPVFLQTEDYKILPETIMDSPHSLLVSGLEPVNLLLETEETSSLVKEIVEPACSPLESDTKKSETVSPESKPSIIKSEIQKNELPDNLPLRPFDDNMRAWPFSLYKDVFHREIESSSVDDKEKIVNNTKDKKENTTYIVGNYSNQDEKLVLLATTMLLVVILLLMYMYTNNRL